MKKNILKKLFIFNATVLMLPFVSSTVFAETSTPKPTVTVNPTISKSPITITELKSKAIQEIDKRLTGLTSLISKITNIKKLTDSQKSSLTSQINTEITNLKDLRTKIDGDKDLSVLKTDVKSIVTSFRVYLFFMPKVELLAFADKLGNIADNMNNLTLKIKTNIDNVKAGNNDVITESYSSYQTKLAEAKQLILAAQNELIPLNVSGYPANKTTLIDARSKLETAKKDLETSRDNLKDVSKSINDARKSQEDINKKLKSENSVNGTPKETESNAQTKNSGSNNEVEKSKVTSTPQTTISITKRTEEKHTPIPTIKITSTEDNSGRR